MFFKKNKKSNAVNIHSPFNGEIILLENVPDPVFSQKLMGDGIGFIPRDGNIVSPVNGKITQIYPTQHAIGMSTKEGLELLIHLGIDTVHLNGEGFHINAEVGDELNVNDPIGTFDLTYIEEKGKKTISMIVFPENQLECDMTTITTGATDAGDEILKLKFN